MVPTLTGNGVGLGSPFSPEPTSLCLLTGGAVSLLAIHLVKLMSVLTVSLEGVLGGHRPRVSEAILAWSYSSQVRYCHTMPVAADMINYHPVANRAGSHVISDSMRSTSFFLEVKRTITIFVQRRRPKPTISVLSPFAIKSLKLAKCISFHMPIVPCMPLIKQGVNYA